MAFLSGGGELGALMRSRDWSGSPLGPPQDWPAALHSVVSLMLGSKFPMFVIWGTELTCLYNDGYVPILGVRHPQALGSPFIRVWPEIWKDISPLIDRALSGQAIYFDNLPLTIESHGFPEQIWVTFSYSPIRDESGAVAGMFCAFTETTTQVLAERRQAFQLEMTDRLRELGEPDDITAVAAELLGRHLGVARVGYAEIDAAGERFRVTRDWTNGSAASLAGETRQLDDFGPAAVAALRAGETLRLDDIVTDVRSAAYADAYASIGTRSLIVVPLIRAGQLSAILYLHETVPRRWSEVDAALAEEVAERTWATVERARAENALKQRLAAEGERLRMMFAQAPGFIAVLRGPDHVFELANAAYLHLVGKRDLVGKPVREVMPEVAGQGFFEMLDHVYASATSVSAHDAPLMLQAKLGAPPTRRFVDFIFQPIIEVDQSVSGIFVEGYDVTQRKLASQALQASEARYRTLVETISAVIWHTDRHGNLLPGNLSWAKFTGQSEAQYVKQGWLDAVHPDDRAATIQSWQTALSQLTSYTTAFRLRRHDGQYRHVVSSAAPVHSDDDLGAEWIGNCTDVTEYRRAEEALRDTDRRKDEFLAMLAHELRNPLAPISTAAQILKMIRVDEPRVQQASDIIQRQVKHMTSLIDDLFDVSRVGRGLVTLERAVLELQQIVSGAVEQVRPLIEKRQHRLTIQMAGEPLYVEGDKTRLVQVLANLLNNAAKYTPEGGEIMLRAETIDGHAEITVQDNGVGIAAQLLPDIFNLFMQGERSSDRSGGGLGVGLALVSNLVRLHGGEVAAHSAGKGKGSVFTVTLPRLQQQVGDIGI